MTRTQSASLSEQILTVVGQTPGITDREMANHLRGNSAPQQPINLAARGLARRGQLVRRKRHDGLIGNFLPGKGEMLLAHGPTPTAPLGTEIHSEDWIKKTLEAWLSRAGWNAEIAWGRRHGTDIRAQRGSEVWLIEVKGVGSLSAMRVNYFLGILGEILQRMDAPEARYSIALPDVPQFRNFWKRLPQLAKKRTGITALFISDCAVVTELTE